VPVKHLLTLTVKGQNLSNMKRIIITLIWVLSVSSVWAQGGEKLSLSLSQMISDETLQHKQINLLVQGDLAAIRSYTENSGGLFRYSVANIATIRIPVHALAGLASSESIRRIEMPANNYTVMNDSMRSTIRANQIHAGIPPLLQGYDGTGVVIGIIDTGVDLTHPDLKDSNGNTRIRHLWDQRKPVAANTPQPYGYGQEWNNTEIDAGLASSSNDMQGFGHGTHVSGITAGNANANGKNKGVAPGAELIEVAFDFNNTTNPTYIDAVDYIFNKAQALGKPCVINASLGDYYGSHDGWDLQSQMISALLNQQSGRVLVAAAGNAGGIPFHLGYNVTSDTSFTWVRHNPAFPNTYFQIWGDTSTFKQIQFSIGADVNTTSASYRGRLNFRNILYNLGVFKQDTLYSSSGTRLAIIQSFGSIQGPAYLLEFNIVPDSNTYAWRLITTGSGRLDSWKFYDGGGGPGFVNTNLPSSAIVPEIVYYKLPDVTSTIVSGFQCLDNVITVGNYGNRNFYIDFNGNPYTDNNVTPGQIVANSSWGPTRDGRLKPDVSAPGSLMLSAGQLSLMAIWQGQPNNVVKIAEGGFHFRDGGTSSSSPVVAGIAALYLQQNPTANAIQVRDAITQCALTDSFTGPFIPNFIWGHGKADALSTLVNCSLSSGVNSGSQQLQMAVFPNPVNQGQTISVVLAGSFGRNTKIEIVDPTGRTLWLQEPNAPGTYEISTASLSEGIYFIRPEKSGNLIRAAKFAVIR
jgi:subtilisin family serine protease